jgi:biopolymer transport protein ExbB
VILRRIGISLPIAALALQLTGTASAQPTPEAATNLKQLYDGILERRAMERAEFDKHKSEYDGAGARQQQMLTEATRNRDQLEETSERLNNTHSANEVRINALSAELRDKSAALGLAEVFGLARQIASDTANILQQSMITTEFAPATGEEWRDDFLRSFSSSRTTPTTAELERVWLEIQREMTASGQVSKYQTRVVQPGGEEVQSEVIRIGPFTALSNGQFLSYLPDLRSLNVLPRQLPPEFMEVAESFQGSTSGYPEAVVDSNRGVLLGLYVERPTIMERIELGEWVGYVIIVVGLLGTLAFLFQLVYLILVRMGVSSQLRNLDRPSANNPLGRVLLAFKGDKNNIEEDADVAELRISEAVLHEVPKLERFQAFLRLSVAAGPLLGLIGTVIGMIMTFQSITESGSSDPKLMANGIGQAMIATVLGLGIAIPLLFANALLNSLSRTVVQILDEQSAGMLAESIEKQRRA